MDRPAHPHRYIRLALRALARGFLPGRPATAPRTAVCLEHFPTIEINGSFYSLQRPSSWQQWYAETPDDFMFTVKGPRFITHILRLREVAAPLANFLASGVLALREKLGPILWQFPPNLKFDAGRFADFLALLPRDTAAALKLARHCDAARMRGRSVLAIDETRPMRHAMEIRNESFLDERFITCCVSTTSRSSSPRRHDSGRCRGTSRRISCTCACTATRRSIAAATSLPLSRVGRGASSSGTPAASRHACRKGPCA